MPTPINKTVTVPTGTSIEMGFIPPAAPVAEFIGSPQTGTVPFTTTFTNQSTGVWTALSWNFGDGSTSSLLNPTHDYVTPGTYTVTLTLTWTGGTVVRTRTAYVLASAVVVQSLTLTTPQGATVGVDATGGLVTNNGSATQSWTLTDDLASTITPASGSTLAGQSTLFTIRPTVAGNHHVTLTNNSGGSVIGSPDLMIAALPVQAATNKYRSQQPLLHQRAHAEYETHTYVNSLAETVVVSNTRQYFDTYHGDVAPGGTTKATWGCGSDYYSLCVRSAWKWTNDGGDWLGKGANAIVDGIPQGTTPWASSPTLPTALPAGETTIDVTDLVKYCDVRSTWYAFFLKIVGTSELTLVGPLHPTLAPSVLEIVRNGVTTVHDLWYASVLVGPTSAQTTSQYPEMAFTSSRPCPIEFHRPTDQSVPCTSATIKLRYAKTAWGTNLSVKVYKTNPFVPDMNNPIPGLASSYPLDVGLFAHPNICAGMWARDDTVITDLLDVDRVGTSAHPWASQSTLRTINQEALYDPTLWGTPGVDAHLASVPMPTAPQMAQLLPHRNITAKGTKAYGIAFNNQTLGPTFKLYTGADLIAEGLPVLAPGLGAVRFRYAYCGVENGQMAYPGTTTGGLPLKDGTGANDLFMQFKRDKMGRVIDVYTRGYYMLGNGWDPNDDDFRYYGVWDADGHPGSMGQFPEQLTPPLNPASAPWRVADRSGKFPGGVQHITGSLPYPTYRRPIANTSPQQYTYHIVGDTPTVKFTGGGGYSNTSGVFGYQGRWAFMQGFYKENHPGPACGGLVLNLEHYDFGNHNDCIPSQAYIKGWDGHWQSAPHLGGLGHLYPRKWYCVEHHWKMNTLAPYVEPPVGGQVLEAGFNVDGYDEWFVDGVFAGRTPLWAHRSSFMINWAYQMAMGQPFDNNDTDSVTRLRPITNVPADEYMGAKEAILQTYYGGQSPCPRDMDIFMNGFVVSDSMYIGPMSGVSRANGGLDTAAPVTIPDWVPTTENTATILSTTNGLLTNTLRSVTAGWYEDYYSYNIRDADSGPVINPYWGTYGAVMITGGGHAGCNDNSVIALEFNQTNATFKRLTNPSCNFGTIADPLTWTTQNKQNNSQATQFSVPPLPTMNTTYGEFADGQPAGAHTYAIPVVLGPTHGGATNGTLVTLIRSSYTYGSSLFAKAAHKVDLATATGATGSYSWQRMTAFTGQNSTAGDPPWFCEVVPTQGRIYYEAHIGTRNPRWFDLALHAAGSDPWVVGTGTPRVNAGQTPYTGAFVHVPERDLLVFAESVAGDLLRVSYMKVAVGDLQPNWVNNITLSLPISVPSGWSALAWCPDNSRLIVGNILSDNQAVFEITIPAVLAGAGAETWTAERVVMNGASSIWPAHASLPAGSSVYKSWRYNPKCKSITAYLSAVRPDIVPQSDSVFVYRPRGV